MRTRTSVVSARLTRGAIVLALVVLSLGQLSVARPVIAQDDAAVDPVGQIAALVPADATVLVTVASDPDSAQWDTAADLLERGGLEDLVYGLINEAVRESDLSASNLDPDQSSVLGGAVAVAARGDSPDSFEPGAIYIVASDPDAAYQSVVAQLLTESGEPVVEQEVPGGKVTVDANGFTGVMLLNGVVIISDSNGLTSIMQLVRGAGPTLAEFDPFAEVMEAQAIDSIARAYINGPGIGQNVIPLLSAAGLGWQEIILVSGLATLVAAYTSLGLTAAADGFHLRAAQLPGRVNGQTLPTDAPSGDLTERVSAEADLFAAGSDLGANPILVQLLNSVVFGVAGGWSEFDPLNPVAQDDPYESLEAATGIDLRSDVLDQLRGDFMLAVAPTTLNGSLSADAVLVSEVADRRAMRDTLNQIVGAFRLFIATQDEEVEFREKAVGDDTLYVISSPEGSGAPISVSFGLVEGELVMAFGDGYERLLSPADGDSLATDPRYQEALAALGDENGQILYLDLHDLIDLAELESLEAPDPSTLPGEPQNASIDAIEALAAVTHDDGDLAITDVVLTIGEAASATTEETEMPAEATPEATSGDIGSITAGEVTIVETNAERALSVSPSGELMLIEDRNENVACLVPFDNLRGEICTPEFRGVDSQHIAWSPDGSLVAFTEDAPRHLVDSDLWIIDGKAGVATNLTDDNYDGGIPLTEEERERAGELPVDIVPIFTPDGEEIVFARTIWGEDEQPTEIYRIPVDGGEAELIATIADMPFVTWGGMTWADADTLLYSYSAADSSDPDTGLWTLNIQSGEAEFVWQSTDEGHRFASPRSVSPDGKAVVVFPMIQGAFAASEDVCAYGMLDLESGGLEPLVDEDSNCARIIGTSPDGRFAIITSGDDGATVSVVDVQTGEAAALDTSAIVEASAGFGDDTPFLTGPNLCHFVWTTDDRIFMLLMSDVMVSWQLNGAS